MKKNFDKNKKLIVLLIILPILLVGQYFMFSRGIISPIVKGVEIKIIGGNYIKDLDKYIIKLGDDVEISAGNYVKIPGYAKDPKLRFNILDDKGIIKIDNNKITALKEGYTSVGVMKGNRVLKKAMLKIVDPNVESLDMDISNKLKYVGDKATITSSVAISDYKKFKNTYKTKYTSSDNSVLKIDKDKVEAVGVGTATISGKCADKIVEIPLKIEAKVADLEVANEYILEEGQVGKITSKITTSPKGLKSPPIKYNYLNRKNKSDRVAYIDDFGKIKAVREGSEKIVVSCGEKSKTIKITVKRRSIKNTFIKNINYNYILKDDKLFLDINWDSIDGIKDYDIYIKNSDMKEYTLAKKISASEEKEGKLETILEVDIPKIDKDTLKLYIVGNGEKEKTKPSEELTIEYSK